MTKNIKNVAMRCTQEQFEAIKPKLEKVELEIKSISSFDTCTYLTNNFSNEGIVISNISPNDYIGMKQVTETYSKWNEKVFLEACGIEVEPVFENKLEIFKPNTYWFHNTGELCFISEVTKNNGGTIKCKHISNDSEHFAYHGISCMDREATTEEITEALKNESIKRGFKEGVFIHRPFGNNLHDSVIDKTIFPDDMDFYYDSKDDYLEHYGFVIYSKGQWAEIIQTKTNVAQKETDFNKVVEDTLSNIQELLLVKGIEYRRNNDPFHNFSIGSQMTGQIPEKVLHGFLLKHLVSYQDMLNDLEKEILPTDELIQAKFNDILVYFIIQKAMFLDRIENQKTE